ncbi:MAG TPA: hypothetical protein VGK18_05765 [Propionicimonas sp.]|uniref:phenylacetate--CoA ligase family protein n=1 Tax=Propionicimonas sp. TaxID=1955623 RepID=UPI002F3E5A56
MDTELLTRVLAQRARLRRHDTWSTERLAGFQAASLVRLRRHASRAPYYAHSLAGLERAPLSELPPLTKSDVMASFDRLLTRQDIDLATVEAHLADLTQADGDPGVPLNRRWWVAATGGTTGQRGVFVWDRREWATVLASYARATTWAGIRVGPRHPVRTAVVSSVVPTHQSAVVGASLRSRLVPTLRLDARSPLAETVEALNTFGPRVLVGYPSVLRPLAHEQLAGRLHLAPQAVMSASEVLSGRAAAEMQAAWVAPPFDVYAATETAGIASTCSAGRRHLYEDLVIVEVVDEAGSPVPDGTIGSGLLATVLFSRTLPLIRYRLSDQISVRRVPCPCGMPYRVLDTIEGREEETLVLRAGSGTVRIHPNVFHAALDDVEVDGWQVVQHTLGLRLLVVTGPRSPSPSELQARLRRALADAGATAVAIEVEVVREIPRTALGKTPLMRRADN